MDIRSSIGHTGRIYIRHARDSQEAWRLMHYYKRNLGDYAKKAGRLSMLQHGAYTLLMDACYDREQFPTKQEAIEWVWASSTAEIEAVEFVLSKFFTLEDGVYVQNRIREELEDYHSKAETNKRIAIERETKRREKNTNRAKASPDDHEPPPNQEPRTKNHTSASHDSIVFDGSNFQNINGHMATWQSAYPAISIQSEMAKAAAWLVANPKNKKSNYARFLNNWFSRAQDKAPPAGGGQKLDDPCRGAL